MKCIVVYQSKTGFTKRYARWIQEALLCNLKELKKVTKKELSSYDTIIFGSYIRIEKVRGWNKIKDLTENNKNKNLILYATGSTPMGSEEYVEKIWKKSVPEKELDSIPHFYMQSGLNYEKMGLAERLMMKGFAAIMNKKRKKDPAGMTEDLSKSYDHSSKEYIQPLVRYVKENCK